MTKKHYTQLAKLLAEKFRVIRNPAEQEAFQAAVYTVAEVLGQANERFDCPRFLAACFPPIPPGADMLDLDDWQMAIDVQSAVNLSGVVRTWSRIMPRIWATVQGTKACNEHPINRLFADKCLMLSYNLTYSDAFQAVHAEIERLKQPE